MSTIIICPRSGNFCTQTGCNKDYFVCDQLPSVATDGARLIPEEKKKPVFIQKITHLQQQHKMSKTYDTNNPVSAPSESQEELWRDFQWRLLCDGKINVSIELLKDIGKHFTITRKPE